MILDVLYTVAILAILYLIIKYVMVLMELHKYPPGPFPLPIIGNLHLIGKNPEKSFKKLSMKYGDVMSLSFGSQRVVVINSIHPAREALIKKGEDFAGRPQDMYLAEIYSRGYEDIGFSDYGVKWKLMRKITHGSMKMYGSGLEDLEKNVLLETKQLFKRLDEKRGVSLDPKKDISLAIVNVICSIVFGNRYDINDKEFMQVIDYMSLIVQGFDNASIISIMPWLRFFPNKGLSMLRKGIRLRDEILDQKIKEHKQTFNPNNIRDFTDALLYEFSKEATEDNKVKRYLNDTNFEQIVSDMFFSGGETTSTTILWCLVYLVTWPEVQLKITEEFKEKLGERPPCVKDRGNLPYLEATIQETLRLSSIVPLGAPHKAMNNSKIDGKDIPKGTPLFINHWAFHYDEREWKETTAFKPERFLDSSGSFVHGMNISFLPFGAGRRVCVGEAMAKLELFLFISHILYRYELKIEAGKAAPDLEGVLGVVLGPKPYEIQFIKRPGVKDIDI